MPNGGSCRLCTSSNLDERMASGSLPEQCPCSHSFSWTNCRHISFFVFEFGWKFPLQIVLVVFCQHSHSCFFFWFLGTLLSPFSYSFLCPRFHVSPFSTFSVACLPADSVILLPIPLPPPPFLQFSCFLAESQLLKALVATPLCPPVMYFPVASQ